MTSYEQALLLTDDASPDALAKLAESSNWTVAGSDHFGYDDYLLNAWQTEDEEHILYVENHLSGTRLVVVTAPAEEAVKSTIAEITAVLPTVSADEVLGVLLAVPPPEPVVLIRAVRQLASLHVISLRHPGASPPPLDPRYREAIARHAAHPNKHVRRAFSLVVTEELTPLWPELAEKLEPEED